MTHSPPKIAIFLWFPFALSLLEVPRKEMARNLAIRLAPRFLLPAATSPINDIQSA